ncbi:MAG: 5-oxoprolinase (ATP-hydrolyzing) subunit [Nocardioidaceae bacterium]|nr:5-oxoprolinase (ATP-hydrolyzing) subunit [Nocardioidaceae bacterium]
MAVSLDLNADVGEGFPHDDDLLEVISSANIACGFHAGDEKTMRRLCRRCAACGVAVGAQVSYRDRAGFGRRTVEIGYDDLRADVAEQLAMIRLAATAAGVSVGYLKPHGALYNRVVHDREQAGAVVDAADGLPVLGLPRSVLLEVAVAAGLRGVREFFADRGYAGDGTLVPRADPGALVTDVDAVAARVGQLLETGTVIALDGSVLSMEADSICVHGDTEGAVSLAGVVARVLTEHGVALRAFT